MTERYLNYIRQERRYSQHTFLSYQTDLFQFGEYLKNFYKNSFPQSATQEMIRSWVIELIDLGVSNRTINRKLSCLKSFYKFLLKEGVVDANPMKGIVSPKVSKRLPAFMTEEMVNLSTIPVVYDDFYSLRQSVVFEILYQTGIRLSELINLEVDNVDFYKQQIKVFGKRNKERLIPVSKQLLELIKRYLDERNECFENHSAFLIVSNKGIKTYPKFIYGSVRSQLEQLGTLSKKSPHVLRHTFATHLLNNGADINSVKELLGHESLASTQVYTHNTIKKLKSIYELAHPRA
ncbi:MAG: tyrosine-type recombinase/integrase [Bacteroidales bacterium]|nr:tyrosine-type recombinase/integrase [Bacteroidales bacterium]